MDLKNKLRTGTKNVSTFGSPYEKARHKLSWKGCDSALLGKAPGDFMGNANIQLPSTKKTPKCAISRADTGRLSNNKSTLPGPSSYV
jgi:hypothetical protein